ncbi:MAG TPA: cytoplasmic filament protein CfpA, partial [bacterium]|nr:cytoplasmic filament protein CfpA [bacterium]
LNHIHAKLPPEVMSRAEVRGTIKPKLHAYFNQNMQNMLNRYLTTVEDEVGKKVRDLVDVEEMRGLNRYTPRPVSYLLDRIGGSDKFHTGEVEKSIVNMFGHLQGHVQREMNDLETHTNSLLRRKTDVGAFVRGENAYAIVKCSFRDYPEKPTTVFQLKLAINILASELISPIFAYQVTVSYLIKDLLSKRIMDAVERELEQINANLVDQGKPELTATQKIFERIKALETQASDEDSETSPRYSVLAKKFLDSIEGVQAEIASSEYDALGLRENVSRVIATENIRNRGYNTAVNSLTHILDWSRMGYQHIENYKSVRRMFIREYESTDGSRLPDERYQIELSYFDLPQILAAREAYSDQLNEFRRTIMELWDVVEKVYEEHRDSTGMLDWETLSNRVLGEPNQPAAPRRSWFAPPTAQPEESTEAVEHKRLWNEITFIQPERAAESKDIPTLEQEFNDLRARFSLMREKLHVVFQDTNPALREIIDGRIVFLEGEFLTFAAQINPYHINPGLLLDVDVVTIKRKSTTMMNMANVLNEFLNAVSKGFSDTAFAGFSRRRSTQRSDLTEEFVTGGGVTEMASQESEEVYK